MSARAIDSGDLLLCDELVDLRIDAVIKDRARPKEIYMHKAGEGGFPANFPWHPIALFTPFDSTVYRR